ncbi:MAG: hypothetical protein IPM35_28190 [Myxococcales bacterium]|nr:hypothetical protein [Myxococcales bacterium]
MSLSRAAAALGLLVALSAGSARAQGRDAAAADALFRDARALMKSGEFKKACPKLYDSQRLDPAAGTAINLGECWERVGKLADALQSYRDALDLLKAGDSRIVPVKTQIAALEKRVPKLTVKLAPGAPEGTRVKRDEVELGEGSLGVALPVNPGEHWVTVVAPGRVDARRKVAVAEGTEVAHLARIGDRARAGDEPAGAEEAEPAQAAPTERAEDLAPTGDARATWTWLSAGVGVAGLSAGLLFLKLAADEDKKADEKIGSQPDNYCRDNPNAPACRDAADARATRDTNRGISTGAFVVGGFGLAAAFTLLVWPRGDASPSATSNLQLLVGSSGAELRGRF